MAIPKKPSARSLRAALRGAWSRYRRQHWSARAARHAGCGRDAEAFACFARAAQAGDVAAQFDVARSYLDGRGVPPSKAAARPWLERAASGGHPDAMVYLAKLALQAVPPGAGDGLGLEEQAAPGAGAALTWARQAAALGSLDGKVALAALLSDGPEAIRDREAAFALLHEAAGEGSGAACLGLALLLARQHPPADPATIARLLQRAAEAGLPMGVYLLGVAREFAFGCVEDVPAATALYRKAAGLGMGAAQTRLGWALVCGRGIKRDPFEGETWLRKAACGQNAQAAALLGHLYAGADEPNFLCAGQWFQRSADLGNPLSARIVGFLHLTGTGLGEDRQAAARWFDRVQHQGSAEMVRDPAQLLIGSRAAMDRHIDVHSWFAGPAAAGDLLAAYRLGITCALGLGGERDDRLAARWLRAAASGLAVAQLEYGQMLLAGRGAATDEPAGRAWIKRAADSGLDDARVAYAELLSNGRGGRRDSEGALVLFTAAAASGHVGAMYALGALHGGGHGIPPNRPLAQRWFRRAAEAGHAQAQLMLGRYLAHGLAGGEDAGAAARWFQKALANGIAETRADLDRLGARSAAVMPKAA